ncbi:hypothetical protein WA1_03555 [Scytonema hofmannii PCC 7110]|uniref:Low-complexity protein n=1 Tax=Scytonema hofmannii PCC 7110 TaxID=128403 RepID=A0A139X8Z0_9CYAN|nr:pentapeptide repeat-containing protein [Scytonema hofmannii]KYC41174.1 hypothetical protein WA1_03555 [Scytonema hofmannii PCC 7110]
MPLDYSGQNLRGRSFRGQNLEGANFSGADIREADFRGANLKGANFKAAQAGLQKRWAIGLVTSLWLISGLSGVVSGSTAYLVSVIFDSNIKNSITGVLSLILIAVFFIITIRQGLGAGLSAVAITVVVTITGALIANLVAGALGIASAVASSIGVAISFALCVACAFFTVGAFSIPFVVSVTGLGSIAVTVALISAMFAHKALAVGVGEPILSTHLHD